MACHRQGPGPAEYSLPPNVGFNLHDIRKTRKPMYSFGLRPPLLVKTFGPGPVVYELQQVNRYGKPDTKAYSMRIKPKLLDKNYGPGPGAHTIKFLGKSTAPSYSMRLQTKLLGRDKGPSPAEYSLKVQTIKNKAPAYSMAPRNEKKLLFQSPGPATYTGVNTNVTKSKAPNYPMGLRFAAMSKQTMSPGPDRYSPQFLTSGYKYPFGIKHTECKHPLVMKGDDK